MGSIFKRGKVWYLDVRVNGKRVRRRVGTSKKIAQLALQDAEVKVARQEFGFARNDILLSKFFEQFLEYSEANHRERTTARYRAVIDHFRAFLDDKHPSLAMMSQLTTEVIDRYTVHRRTSWVNPNGQAVETDTDVKDHTRKGARAHTINFEVATLKTIFNLAIKWGYLRENPSKSVKKLKVDDAKQVRFLSQDECKRLLDACSADLYPIYFTFLNTGMRKAELENLVWDDIDFERRKIKIRRKDFWQPKTGEREIPMSEQVYQLLQRLYGETPKNRRDGFVFCEENGNQLKTKLRERLIRIAKQAGIEDLTKLHTLRHTFASHPVMKGVDLPTVQKLMGHSDIQTTMIYAHLAPDHLADAVNKLDLS